MKMLSLEYTGLVDFGVKASAEKGVSFAEVQQAFLRAVRAAYPPEASIIAAANAGFLKIMAAEGGSVTAAEAAKLYGGRAPVTAEAMRKAAKAAQIIGVQDGLGEWMFPVWQFSERGGVITGLREVLAALKEGHPAYSDLTPVTFFLNASPYLDGLTPLQALKAGNIEAVKKQAIATHE
jgi:hypothetical protein